MSRSCQRFERLAFPPMDLSLLFLHALKGITYLLEAQTFRPLKFVGKWKHRKTERLLKACIRTSTFYLLSLQVEIWLGPTAYAYGLMSKKVASLTSHKSTRNNSCQKQGSQSKHNKQNLSKLTCWNKTYNIRPNLGLNWERCFPVLQPPLKSFGIKFRQRDSLILEQVLIDKRLEVLPRVYFFLG